MAVISTLSIGLVVVYTIWTLQSWLANYRIARRSGFPLLVTPANTNNLIWIIFSVACRPLLALLPAPLYNRIKPAIYGWEFLYKGQVFDRLGPSFMLVMPGKNELWVADPEVAHTMLTRRNDFLTLSIANRIMAMFGRNVLSSDGDDWQRQRKIVAPLLNERISKLVWSESSTQAIELLASLARESSGDTRSQGGKTADLPATRSTVAGVRTIAINVLGSVAYGDQQSFSSESAKPPPGYKLAYMDTILALVQNLIPATFISSTILTSPVMPANVQRIGHSVHEFPKHVQALLSRERASSRSGQANLLSTLVAASDAESKQSKFHLSESELAGNLFQFTIAGYDTTANTMAYAINLLAIDSEWQDWIQEEIDAVAHTSGDDYEAAFPKLKRCLALMLETLRLYTPIPHISRETRSAQMIPNPNGRNDLFVPADTTIYISGQGMNVAPDQWGTDAMDFKPERWLTGPAEATPTVSADGAKLDNESGFIDRARGSFLAWGGGPRVCPGMKMAQVEFVAVIFTIFKDWKVRPTVLEEKGETEEMAGQRLRDVLKDSQPAVTLQMNRPRDAILTWTRR